MTRNPFLITCLLIVILGAGACSPKPKTALPAVTPTQTAALNDAPPPAAVTAGPAVQEELPTPGFRDQFQSGLIKTEQETLQLLPGASQYTLEITLPESLESLQGHQLVRYTNQEDAPLDEIYFRLFANTAGGSSQLNSVTVNGRSAQIIYEYEKSAVRLPLDPPLPVGETAEIEMKFLVGIPLEMGGNYGLFGYFDGVLVLDEFYPVIPVYDEQGWNVELPPPNADLPYFDASFYKVTVTAPAGLLLVASGVEVSREETADNQVVTYAAGPARGFYLAASDQFILNSLQAGETQINCYTLPAGSQASARTLETAENALEIFGGYLGAYPYSELDIVSTPMLALGMEYPGLTAISTQLFSDPERIGYLEATVAHEIGHQWFFNVVGNDQVDHPWLDEAVVQYLTYRYMLDFRGPEAAQGLIENWQGRWERVENEKIPIGLPAREYSGTEYSAIVYGRGPLFIKALAERMGVNTFDAFLKDYTTQNWWGIGTPLEFKDLAEKHCSCDLTSLFDEWVNP